MLLVCLTVKQADKLLIGTYGVFGVVKKEGEKNESKPGEEENYGL